MVIVPPFVLLLPQQYTSAAPPKLLMSSDNMKGKGVQDWDSMVQILRTCCRFYSAALDQ